MYLLFQGGTAEAVFHGLPEEKHHAEPPISISLGPVGSLDQKLSSALCGHGEADPWGVGSGFKSAPSAAEARLLVLLLREVGNVERLPLLK